MSVTFHFQLKSEPNKQGEYVVFLRITQNRKSKKVKTTIALKSKNDWNKTKERVRSSEPNYAVWNDVLDKELERAKMVYRSLDSEGVASQTNIINALKDDSAKPMLLEYTNRIIDILGEASQIETSRGYLTFSRYLTRYLKEKKMDDISFKEVNLGMVEDYYSFLSRQKNRNSDGRLTKNTIAKYMKIFRAIVSRSISDGYMKEEDNPFRNFRIREERVEKRSLEKSELIALYKLDLKEQSALWNTRNAFIFAVFCEGMRIGDLLRLRWRNISAGGFLQYKMGKSKKTKNFRIIDQAKEILKLYHKEGQNIDDYIFPFLDNDAEYSKFVAKNGRGSMPTELAKAESDAVHSAEMHINKNMKVLAGMAGINRRVTFHVSRHTFAQISYDRGENVVVTQQRLAHGSPNETAGYLNSLGSVKEGTSLQKMIDDFFKEDDNQNNGSNRIAEATRALSALSKEELETVLKMLPQAK